MMQEDLFGPPGSAVSGLGFQDSFISPSEETELIAQIETLSLPYFPFQQWVSRRRTRSFGWLYDFQKSDFGQTDSIPTFLLPLRERAAEFGRVPADELVQVSLIKYEPGAGIG